MNHFSSRSVRTLFFLAMVSALYAAPAAAAPEEIQVYMDEFAEKGKFGLDLHTIYTLSTKDDLRQAPAANYG